MAKRGRPPKKNKKKETPPETYDVYRDPLIQQFQKERNVKYSTMQGYMSSLKRYIPFMGFKNAEEMIQEALEDERDRVPIKEARISTHLREYILYLQDNDDVKSSQSIHTYFTKIETFYRHYNVTVPPRPPMKIEKKHVGYYDLPDKLMIEQAINQSDAQMGAVLYFMSSSGTGKVETVNLTVGAFISGLRDYTKNTDPERVVMELRGRRDLVPCINMTRQKTNVPYYTCCSPEATYHILEFMFLEKKYAPDDTLFGISGSTLMHRFQELNDRNRWGYVGEFRRFRSHMIRKFHASNLGASFDLINTLEGRTNGVIHETYVKQRPDDLKREYMKYMHNVMIHPELFECPRYDNGGGVEAQVVSVGDDFPTVQQEVQQVQQQPQVQMLQQAPFDYNILKDIARVEARMDALEKRIEELENEE